MEAAIKGCSVHEVNWIYYAQIPKRGWLEKDCGVVWEFTGELGQLLLIWVGLVPGQKGVKQRRGQEESVGRLFQLCECWAHVIRCSRTNPSIFFIACPLALLTSQCAGVQLTPQASSNPWAALVQVTCQFSRKQHRGTSSQMSSSFPCPWDLLNRSMAITGCTLICLLWLLFHLVCEAEDSYIARLDQYCQ